MKSSSLIKQSETLSYAKRSNYLSTTAIALRNTDPNGLERLIDDLRRGDRYSRELALTVARAVDGGTALIGMLDDSDAFVRTIAIGSLPKIATFSPDEASAAYQGASARERSALIRAIIVGRRPDLADAVLEQAVLAYRLREAAHLLAAASDASVDRWIDELSPASASGRALARRHPHRFLVASRAELDHLPPRSRTEWWARRSDAVADLVLISAELADQVLALMRDLPPSGGWAGTHSHLVSVLMARLPADAATLLTVNLPRDERTKAFPRLSRRAIRALFELGTDAALPLVLAYLTRAPRSYGRVMHLAPPVERTPVLARLILTHRNSASTPELQAALPAETRVALAREETARMEATGHWSVRALAGLPFAEAEPQLRKLLASSVASNRADAYRYLLQAVAMTRDPAQVSRVLSSFDRLPNEQEPVRAAAIGGMSTLPLSLLATTPGTTLNKLVEDAYAARDHSAASANAIRSLAARILCATGADRPVAHLNDFAVAALVHGNGPVAFPPLAEMPRSAVADIVSALRHVLQEHADRDRFDVTFALIKALGERARGVTELDLLLERALGSENINTVRKAIGPWLDDPQTRTLRARALVAGELSLITEPAVERVIVGSATDLLSPSVIAGRVAGRFHSSSKVWIPAAWTSSRWTGVQREQLAAHLRTIANRPATDLSLRQSALRSAGMLAGYGAPLLREWAESQESLDSELALTLLGGVTDDRGGDAELVRALASDRARVAGPSIVRRSGILRPTDVLNLVVSAMAAPIKLTSRKSLLFALARAEVRDPWLAVEAVLGADPHHDLIEAQASASLWRLDDPRAIDFVKRFLASSERASGLLSRAGVTYCSVSGREELGDLLAIVCRSDSPDIRERGLWAAQKWVSFSGELRSTIWRTIADIESPTDAIATGFVVAVLLEDGNAAGLTDVVRDLLDALERNPAQIAGKTVDEPLIRRRIERMLRLEVLSREGHLPDASVTELIAVLNLLFEREDFTVVAARIALLLMVNASAPAIESVDLLVQAMRGRVSVAIEVVSHLELVRADNADSLTGWRLAVDSLSAAGVAEQLVAVGVVARFGQKRGWPDEWRGLLDTLRVSREPEVREFALRIATDTGPRSRRSQFEL